MKDWYCRKIIEIIFNFVGNVYDNHERRFLITGHIIKILTLKNHAFFTAMLL